MSGTRTAGGGVASGRGGGPGGGVASGRGGGPGGGVASGDGDSAPRTARGDGSGGNDGMPAMVGTETRDRDSAGAASPTPGGTWVSTAVLAS